MSNYKELYFTLFAGMSNLVEEWRPLTTEGHIARESMIELMRRCEDLYIQ